MNNSHRSACHSFIDGEVCLGFGVGGAVGDRMVAGAVQADQLVVEEEAIFACLRGDGRALVSLCYGDIEPAGPPVLGVMMMRGSYR
ncbi:hypothetical protein [Cobetia sp. L2A1]|uniref:hypothetical protein n=1 Tax=Cobetia sp. L2A1 TaxID=2686360 RepID=UPI00131BB097|nr:hypothetical protein [Cobetia sp. L2A1]